MKEFGQRLMSVRKAKKLSQNDLAHKIGIHPNVLGRYERGESKLFLGVAQKLSKALDVSIDYLLSGNNQELDPEVVKRIQEVSKLSDEDKKNIFYTIDNLVKAAKLKSI